MKKQEDRSPRLISSLPTSALILPPSSFEVLPAAGFEIPGARAFYDPHAIRRLSNLTNTSCGNAVHSRRQFGNIFWFDGEQEFKVFSAMEGEHQRIQRPA